MKILALIILILVFYFVKAIMAAVSEGGKVILRGVEEAKWYFNTLAPAYEPQPNMSASSSSQAKRDAPEYTDDTSKYTRVVEENILTTFNYLDVDDCYNSDFYSEIEARLKQYNSIRNEIIKCKPNYEILIGRCFKDTMPISNLNEYITFVDDIDGIVMVSKKHIEGQIILAICYLAQRYNIEDYDLDKIVKHIFNDIKGKGLFSEYLPFYFWGAVDSLLQKRKIDVGAKGFQYIHSALYEIYGFTKSCKMCNFIVKTHEGEHQSCKQKVMQISKNGGNDMLALIKDVSNNSGIGGSKFYSYILENHSELLINYFTT